MNNLFVRALSSLVVVLVFCCSPGYCASSKEMEKVELAALTLDEIMRVPESGIPPSLLGSAYAVAVIPNMIKAGLVVGGRFGTGVICVRLPDGRWSSPLFLSMGGGSIGLQVGVQSTDVILVFKNQEGVQNILNGKVTLGGSLAAAAGPVGRRMEAATDLQLSAGILSYSRARGLFAGVSLEGASLEVDHEANNRFYGKGINEEAVLAGNVPIIKPVEKLQKALLTYANH